MFYYCRMRTTWTVGIAVLVLLGIVWLAKARETERVEVIREMGSAYEHRVERGAYLDEIHRLDDGGTIRQITIPSRRRAGIPVFDSQCFIYEHPDLPNHLMACTSGIR